VVVAVVTRTEQGEEAVTELDPAIINAYQEACRHRDQWGEAADVLRRRIETALNDAEEGTVNGQRIVTWRWSETRRLDQKILKARHPDILAECTTTQRSRRFLLHTPPGGTA
jgi:predicted phage-related endonuclease